MYKNILAEMARKDYTREKLANDMNICHTTLRKKISGTKQWKTKEIDYLLSLFGTTYEYLFQKF